MHDEVTVHMDATADEVFDLVSDVTKIGRYSPETFEGEWLDGATGPAVGVKFRGHVKRNEKGPIYWTTCEIQKCEPGRLFEFGVITGGKVLNVWGYRIAPAEGGGVDVTESFTLAPTLGLRLYWAILGWARGKTNHKGMKRTLEAIKAEVESS